MNGQDGGGRIEHALAGGRRAYVHVVRGAVSVNGVALSGGDAALLEGEAQVSLDQAKDAEVLFFDLQA